MRHHEFIGLPHRLACHVVSASELLRDADELATDKQFDPRIREQIENATTLLHTCHALIADQHGRPRNGERDALGIR